MTRQSNLTQPQRLASLVIDSLIVAAACWYLFGTPYPPLGTDGFWAYSALLAVLVGSKLVTPFYVKPADAISYAVPALVSLMLVNDWRSWSPNQQWGFSLTALFALLVLLLGVTNIIINSMRGDRAKELSNRTRVILDLIARPEFVYAPLILFALFSYHRDSWIEAVTISIVTGVTVLKSAGDFLVGGIQRLRSLTKLTAAAAAGQVVAFQDPGIVLLRQQYEGDINRNDLLFVSDKHGPKKLVVALDYVGRSEGILIRAVELKALSAASQAIVGAVPFDEYAYRLEAQTLDRVCECERISRDAQANVVGICAPDTSIERLYFEVVDNSELEEGRLVSAHVGMVKVMYQIVAGLTREEIVQQKNTYGYLRAQAQQIGVWDETAKKFRPCNWLPTINTPIYLEKKKSYEIDERSIGHFPGSDFHGRIRSTADLVTHNTAILGILGIGKSCLAFELVERMIADNIKVICLDLTDEYAEQLREFCYDLSGDSLYSELLDQTGAKGKGMVSKHVEEGGSKPEFRDALDASIERFVCEDLGRKLLVFNPSRFEVWRQDSKPYQDQASMASLTPTEITQLFTEGALKACQKLGRVGKGSARVCLVFEEAHSLVPEWNTIVNEGDRAAVNGTARAILQGRKYGLGCLLVTQRTANVTKTILNQCNTIFAMRTFDETAKEFLANYIGRDYTDSLSAIQERHAVLFGKASSCENPVLIRLNDTDAFRAAFRPAHPVPTVPQAVATLAVAAATTATDTSGETEFNDDIPF